MNPRTRTASLTARTCIAAWAAGLAIVACDQAAKAPPSSTEQVRPEVTAIDVPMAGAKAAAAPADAKAAAAPAKVEAKVKAPDAVAAAAPVPRPVTAKKPVTDVHHGVELVDAYRWLEDWSDTAVQAWSASQNAHARSNLDALPGADVLRARVREVLAAESVTFWSVRQQGGLVFAMKRQPPKQQPFLVVLDGLDDATGGRALVDPEKIDASGHTAIDWFEPSPDGKIIAVSLSKGGTESGDVHLFDTTTGEQVHEVIPGVNGGTAGGSLAWKPDGTGFWYTRYPRGAERPDDEKAFWVQVYWHALGTPTDKDVYELGKGLPKIAEYQLAVDPGSGRVLATVQDGDGGEFAHFLRGASGKWRQFSKFGDKTLVAAFGPNDMIYVLSRAGAPRGKILRTTVKALDVAKAEVIVPEGEATIVEDFWGSPTILPLETRMFVLYQLGGPSEIRTFDLDGGPRPGPQQAPVSSVGGMEPLGGDDVLFSLRSFVSPTVYYRFDAKAGTTAPTAVASTSPVTFEDVDVVREFAVSKDGTKIPVNILMKKGTPLDGSRPAIVTGYGGYGVNLTPRMRMTDRIGLDHGVVYAVANLRGGGEYGEQWHRQGNLTNKQNVFDDFAAVLRHMVARGYTTQDKLGIIGGSNGGLLMGATFTQHPELPAAVVSFVGIYDMLRVELSANGAFNIPEFGTVKDKAHFEAMHAYSPYHRVVDGTAYPPILFLTGENDPRVDPMQSRKMTARLQAAVGTSPTPEVPILLRTSSDAGHGGDTKLDERVAQWTDVYSFLFHHLGVKAVGKAAPAPAPAPAPAAPAAAAPAPAKPAQMPKPVAAPPAPASP